MENIIVQGILVFFCVVGFLTIAGLVINYLVDKFN
jgi:hypothetical protein